jgi:HAD superfamily phosphoserine phosphatase-like hydrolase
MGKRYIILDFDETLYLKDSLIAFHLFCLRKYPFIALWFPVQLVGYILHKATLISTQQFKNIYLLFLAFQSPARIQKNARQFWEKEFPVNFNTALLPLLAESPEDIVIITASPVLYIEPLLAKLPPLTLLGTHIKSHFGLYVIDGKNCKGHEKVLRFKQHFGNNFTVTKSFSDSLSDTPVLNLAEQAFIVKGNQVTSYMP